MASAPEHSGPLVARIVHPAGALWLVGSLQFVLAMVIVQLAWTGHPGYSLANNYISDLGNTHCGPWPNASSPDLCSPLHDVFNASVIVLGLLAMLGAALVRTGLPARQTGAVGRVLIAVAGAGAVGVGLFPENVALTVHEAVSADAFLAGSLALIALSLAMANDARWDALRAYTFVSGVVGLLATILFLAGENLGLGAGGMERLIVAPLLLWLLVVGVRLLRLPQYAPRGVPAP
jgi:hypothetical membrane protein